MGLLFTFAAALAWAGLDALRKHLSLQVAPLALAVALFLGQVPPFVAVVITDGAWPRAIDYFLPGTIVAVANAGASLLFLASVRIAPLSLTIPLLSLTPALSALIAAALLDEIPSVADGVGIVAVVAGALVISRAPAEARPPVRADAAAVDVGDRRGLWMMLAVACLWSVTTSVDKVALRSAPFTFHAAFQMAVGAAILGLVLVARGGVGEIRSVARRPLAFLLALAFLAGAIAFQLLALDGDVPVAVIETVKRALGMVVALVVGRTWFHEPIGARVLVGVALMITGTALLLLY